MNNMKIKKIISILLVLILLISFPLETQANAVAVESWVIYALITYLTAMGITFTVAGGVDAMVQAMEEKADEFQQKGVIIDFYDVMRNNIKLVPKPDPDPSGNQFLDLFFTAVGVEAINEFLQWLTTEGGWSNGTVQTDHINQSTFSAKLNGADTVIATSTIVNHQMVNRGTVFELDWDSTYHFQIKIPKDVGSAIYTFSIPQTDSSYVAGLRLDTTGSYKGFLYTYTGTSSSSNASRNIKTYYFKDTNYTIDDIAGIYFIDYNSNRVYPGFLLNDGYCINCADTLITPDKVTLNSEITIDIPTEIEILSPAPSEGALLNQDFIGSPDLIEWSNWVEEIFTDTGTIPQPIPEIVQDPDIAPEPTPAPTPVPSPEIEDIEDLGLPTLGEAIFSKFPFSLPKDVGRIFNLLHAEPVTPYWQVDLTGDALGIPSNFEVDLAEYEVLGQITRWFSVVSYCLFLILITRGMIKW